MNTLIYIAALVAAILIIYAGYKAIRQTIQKNKEFERQYRYALRLQMDRELDQAAHQARVMETLARWEKEGARPAPRRADSPRSASTDTTDLTNPLNPASPLWYGNTVTSPEHIPTRHEQNHHTPSHDSGTSYSHTPSHSHDHTSASSYDSGSSYDSSGSSSDSGSSSGGSDW